MAAGGAAGDANAVWVDTIFCSIGPNPADCCLGVMYRSRELVFRSEPIGNCDGCKAIAGQILNEAIVAIAFAGAEAAAVDADNTGQGAFGIFGPGHIELEVLAIGVGIFDVFLKNNFGWRGILLRWVCQGW